MSFESTTQKDSILEFFTQASNKHDFSLDITLNINGAIVTGTTVSAKEYFDTLSDSIGAGNDVAEKLSEQFANAGQALEDNNGAETNYIHLKNTKVYVGDNKPTPSKGKILWRGKISEIDGFFLGRISDSK
ncbi:gas vesicle accessory protein GvpU [Guptibacillus hwajinpoensis]|uniref:Gas vesicle protein GvpU n=1 Tax=Guptibacillus hwajinpoensis TaxID=208199 RepID=A0A0J6CU32_9BACL|nr:gas vesicle accessory protein GvpU [Alkalihalobacillus macyae]KMM36693.1 gas vesicle protein GvpU [Alkalihalobacillus macyae]MDP4551613.1 gas vesicle accessory protein GvpU [Alkalihalobacillus macyae]